MFPIAKSATLFALLAAAAPALAQVSTADIALDNAAQCPLPENTGDINANVLAVVQFAETATVSATALADVNVPISLGVCLCVDAAVAAANGPVALPTYLNADVDAQTRAYIDANAATSALLGLADTTLNALGGDVAVTIAPSNDVNTCTCGPNSIPGCADAGCLCTPCPDGQTYSALTGVCVDIIVDPLPGPSQAAGAAARMARARRSAEASVFAKYQAKRSDIVSRVARLR